MKRLLICSLLVAVVLLLARSASSVQADGPLGPFIVGGQDVPDPNPYVWQVSIGKKGVPNNDDDNQGHFCGGSLIADKWVLTAAHCVIGDTPDQDETAAGIRVIYGRRVRSQDTTGTEVDVLQIITHENYVRGNIGAGNDIALLELAAAITDNSLLVPLMTAGQEATLGAPGTNATVSGWGGLIGYPPDQQGPPGGQQFPDILQFVEIPIISNETCNQANGGIIDSMVCAGLAEGGKDACQNDSGGPLVVPNGQGGYIQIGVVSYGPGCAAPNAYGVYTRVSSFIDWVNGKIGGGGGNNFIYLPAVLR